MVKELIAKQFVVKGKEITFKFLSTKDAVVVLPVLPDGRVVLIKQFRHAVDTELFELPAGGIEKGEEPLAAAHRELREETGYRADSIEELVNFFPSPGITTEKMYLYLAKVSRQEEQDLDDGEEIQVFYFTLPEALKMIETGEIRDGKTIVGLLMYRFSSPSIAQK
ncbi:MAG: NUDIX hydrolase [Clostridia bacterium]|nr:NUDIX hydrolase [Clostridia bacterium]